MRGSQFLYLFNIKLISFVFVWEMRIEGYGRRNLANKRGAYPVILIFFIKILSYAIFKYIKYEIEH